MKKYYFIILLFFIVGFLNAESKRIEFEIENKSYKWNVSYVYYVDGKLYTIPGELSFPKVVSVLYEGNNNHTLLDIEEIV